MERYVEVGVGAKKTRRPPSSDIWVSVRQRAVDMFCLMHSLGLGNTDASERLAHGAELRHPQQTRP
jgi:hypothetical protein